MVGVSYHELNALSGATTTKRTERHTAGERKQFLVICVLGAAVLLNAFINSGIMEPVIISDDGIYPGGDFVYKLVENKDYSATGGLWRKMREILKTEEEESDGVFDDDLYSVYVDNVEGGIGRFFIGLIIGKDKDHLKERLLQNNEDTLKLKQMNDEANEFDLADYKVGDLPSVRSAVAVFPFTDGFVSGLLHNYKVFPAFAEYAKENSHIFGKDNRILISTTCNREKQMCTHYMPMIKGKDFLMGHVDTEEYLSSGGKIEVIDFDLEKTLKGLKKMIGL